MSLAKTVRAENHKIALKLMLEQLGEQPIDTAFFESSSKAFENVLRTTWEELRDQGYLEKMGERCRLTPKGWLVALEISGLRQSETFHKHIGRVFAVMKGHVEGQKDSVVVPFRQLVDESQESEGLVFNIVECKPSSSEDERARARWYNGEKGRLVEIPVNFNLDPPDIASALTVHHLQKIEELEQRLHEAEEDRAQFHCPHCDAPLVGIGDQDYPEHHCVVTYESYACGYVAADGYEDVPCPYGPNYPGLEEFDFKTEQQGNLWVCYAIPKTARARRVHFFRATAFSKEEAERQAQESVAPKKKVEREIPRPDSSGAY